MEKLFKVNVKFEVISQHSMNVLATGNTKEEVKNNAILQIDNKARFYMTSGDYNTEIIEYKPTEIVADVVEVQKKKTPLTDVQIGIVIELLKGEQLCFNVERNRWECRNQLVEPRTITSMIKKDVIRCISISDEEKEVQVALGTMSWDTMQLVLNRKADVIKKCVKLQNLLQSP